MELNRKSIQNKEVWNSAGVLTPLYDVDRMIAETRKNPVWVHFGAGNIFRGFIAGLQQKLLNAGLSHAGIIAVDSFDFDIIEKIYKPYDNLTLNVGLKPDGLTKKEIIASVAESLKADSSGWSRLSEIFCSPSLQIVSFTITEKGYAVFDMNRQLFPFVQADIEAGPSAPKHAMSILASLMLLRFQAGSHPVTLLSMDNCSHNGQKLQESVLEIARGWQTKGFVGKEFLAYLTDNSKVGFPWSMIDKITPRPSVVIEAELASAGITGMSPVITSKNTYIAPFVNAEIPEYLVVEDNFPNSRPPLDKAGVFLTDRDTVNKTERMKVTTCLNPLHTALAVFGCLLGYEKISDEVKDPDLKSLIERIGYREGMPVVTDPLIIKPVDFIREVIEERLPNPFIPDAPARIATDTSQKVGIRFGETIKSYIANPDLHVLDLTYIPLVIAAWMRYLLGFDDQGQTMQISPDPMAGELQKALAGIESGKPQSYTGQLKPILANSALFGADLCACGLSEKIEIMFCKMLNGKGAVRSTLSHYIRL
jgi:fructuronate reductase